MFWLKWSVEKETVLTPCGHFTVSVRPVVSSLMNFHSFTVSCWKRCWNLNHVSIRPRWNICIIVLTTSCHQGAPSNTWAVNEAQMQNKPSKTSTHIFYSSKSRSTTVLHLKSYFSKSTTFANWIYVILLDCQCVHFNVSAGKRFYTLLCSLICNNTSQFIHWYLY